MANQKPLFKGKIGKIHYAVFRNETEKGTYLNTKVYRCYKDEKESAKKGQDVFRKSYDIPDYLLDDYERAFQTAKALVEQEKGISETAA